MEHEFCPICLDIILEKNNCVTQCYHKFCFSCIIESCKYKNTCPICRVELYEYNDDDNDNENNIIEEQNQIIPVHIENQITIIVRNILLDNIAMTNTRQFILYLQYLHYIYILTNFNYNFFINPIMVSLKYFLNITTLTMVSSFGFYTGIILGSKIVSYFSY
jgi:hypothetical protein